MQCRLCSVQLTEQQIKYRNKFCSKNCSAKFNNRIRARKPYTGSKIKEARLRRSSNAISSYESNPRNCIVCTGPIAYKYKQNKTCGEKCFSIISKQNGSIAGRISASKVVRRSKQEIELFELCQKTFSNVKPNHIIADGWDADIVLVDEKIAIMWNGPWHYKQMPHKNHSLLQVQTRDKIKTDIFRKLGYLVLVFEDRYYTPKSAFEKLVGAPRFELG